VTDNFWTRRAVSRRSALRGAGLGAAGLLGAALIGCGDDDDDGPAPAAQQAATAAPTQAAAAQATAAATEAAAPGILTPRKDVTASAQYGGVYQGITGAEPENLDPLNATSYKAPGVSRWVYPQLVQAAPGITVPASGEVEGQLAESFEYTDTTTLILHLRTNAKWDEREPTSSRPVDAEDVAFSWKKFAELSNSRKSLVNSLNPLAPVLDVTAVDDQTVQIKTAFPFGPLLNAFPTRAGSRSCRASRTAATTPVRRCVARARGC
jgi:ABC-type transport system substrate-binding protein